MKILFDTDIGSDIDDALCLAYLLANPSCDLLGVTTVTGEAEKRAMIISALCQNAGKNIPIFPGAETPLLISQKQIQAPQALALDKWPHKKSFPKREAVRFLQETIRNNPHEITLLATGPLTNIAQLFKIDEEIPSLLKGLVLMCGAFNDKAANLGTCDSVEWNALVDPHAADIVYKSAVKSHKSVGLNVTCKVKLKKEVLKKRLSVSHLLTPIADFAEIWFQEEGEATFHDPLAAITIFNQDVCVFENGKVEVELISEELKGMTYFTPGEGQNQVALHVNIDKFFDSYFAVFK
ncbi:MAG: nucleoside hydrolase [Candidatus Levybacteria bacterium]|nr:nucleoside hydrolase [Candidatus Levybacteria bacterium]